MASASHAPKSLAPLAEPTLFIVTAIWGTTFLAIQHVLGAWPPFLLMMARFTLALAVLLPMTRRIRSPVQASSRIIKEGVALAAFAFAGFALQTFSLQHTSQAHCAFATSLVTVIVPPLSSLIFRTKWHATTSLAIMGSAVGITILSGDNLQPSVRLGDCLAVGGALAFAGQILLLDRFAKHSPLLPLVTMEVAAIALFSAIAAAITQQTAPALGDAWLTLVYLGVVATGLCMVGQVFGQSITTCTRAAFIYALEPLFAAAFAWAWCGQVLSRAEMLGGALLAFSTLIADRPLPKLFKATS